VFAVQQPAPNLALLDRILVQAELMGLANVVVFNKADLDLGRAEELRAIYASIPYPTILTSTVTSQGMEELRRVVQGKISVLAGPSGAGKSSLLNALNPDLDLETGQVSSKIQRGRHTTRRVELLAFDQGYVADTPGFSQLYLEPGQEDRLQFAFPEFEPLPGCLPLPGAVCTAGNRAAPFWRRWSGGKLQPAVTSIISLFLEEVTPRY